MAREEHSTGRPQGWIVGGIVALVGAAAATWALAVVRPNARELAALHARFEGRRGAYSRGRYIRPVLRGERTPGNAFAAQTRALATLGAIPDEVMDGLGETLASGAPPTALTLAFVSAHGDALNELRESTQREWSFANLPPRPGVTEPDILPRARAALLLVAAARMSPPQRCMAEAADAVRVMQDASAGLGLLGVVAPSFVVEPAARVALDCAGRSTGEERRAAATELSILVGSPPHLNRGLEVETLRVMAQLDVAATHADAFPRPGDDLESGMRDRYALVEALRVYDRTFDQLSALGYDAFGQALEAVEARDVRVASSTNTLVKALSSRWRPHVERAGVALARLRAWALALRFADDPRAGESDAADTLFADPFGSKRLRVERSAQDTITVWSVGPDGEDDAHAEGSDDVWVTLSVPTPDTEAPAPTAPRTPEAP